jgi:GST-like protein
MIDFHFCPTPNGHKVTIFLEEAGLEYRVIPYDIFKGEHKTEEFRRINPNQRLPAIVDHDPLTGTEPFSVFESGAILLYLAEKTGLFLESKGRRRSLAQQWLMWQMAGLGPMLGQSIYFVRYAPEGQTFSVNRYNTESLRLLNVLEERLKRVDYLAETYSIADMAVWPLLIGFGLVGIDISPFSATLDWNQRVGERAAVKRAVGSRELKMPEKYTQSRSSLTEEQRAMLFHERPSASAGAAKS